MDHVAAIKARLPIEELVRQYCQLQKKGRNFVCLCPFHNDTHPSFLVSPDKGIAYCFACQSGGDIFSFYQKIERVDFPQAVRDLAEKTGVELPKENPRAPDKDEKERVRSCLEEAAAWYRQQLASAPGVAEYLAARGVSPEERETFGLGFAPDSFSATYDYLLKRGHNKTDIVHAGMTVERSVGQDQRYDRFRNRLMFPVHDAQGRLCGFAGRTMAGDDAKYMNSSDGMLFHKSQLLFNMHRAKDAMRKADRAVVVEGYFDVLAARRVGVEHVVAACGTALTQDHARLLRRAVSTVVLCFDSDKAGRDAAERAFLVLAPEGVAVHSVTLPQKDAADLALSDPELLRTLLTRDTRPYVDEVLEGLRGEDIRSAAGRRAAVERMKPLLAALPTSVERAHYRGVLASALGLTEADVQRDLAGEGTHRVQQHVSPSLFTSAEICLGLLLLYPRMRALLSEMIEPEEEFAGLLHRALGALPEGAETSLDLLSLDSPQRERASVLMLYCEQNGFGAWSELLAPKEIRRNIVIANRDLLRRKQREVGEKLLRAKRDGKPADEALLTTEYQHLLTLAKRSA